MPYKDKEKEKEAKKEWARAHRQGGKVLQKGSTNVEPKSIEPCKVEPDVEPDVEPVEPNVEPYIEPKHVEPVEPVTPASPDAARLMIEKLIKFGERLSKVEEAVEQHRERLEKLEEMLQDFQAGSPHRSPTVRHTSRDVDELPFSKHRQVMNQMGKL